MARVTVSGKGRRLVLFTAGVLPWLALWGIIGAVRALVVALACWTVALVVLRRIDTGA